MLGLDFLDKYHATINFSTKKVSVLNNNYGLPVVGARKNGSEGIGIHLCPSPVRMHHASKGKGQRRDSGCHWLWTRAVSVSAHLLVCMLIPSLGYKRRVDSWLQRDDAHPPPPSPPPLSRILSSLAQSGAEHCILYIRYADVLPICLLIIINMLYWSIFVCVLCTHRGQVQECCMAEYERMIMYMGTWTETYIGHMLNCTHT